MFDIRSVDFWYTDNQVVNTFYFLSSYYTPFLPLNSSSFILLSSLVNSISSLPFILQILFYVLNFIRAFQ